VEESLAGDAVIHPLLVIAVFSSVFLQICPFADHNQKLLRMLVVIYMLKAGYAYVPYVQIDALMNERAELMYGALAHNQGSLEAGAPDWSRWLHFFLSLMHGQKDVLHSRLLSKEKDLSHLPTLSAKVMALFEDHQRLQMKEIIKLTNGRRATIKVRLHELVEGAYLVRHGAGRSTWYALV
jgi:Fic family protein